MTNLLTTLLEVWSDPVVVFVGDHVVFANEAFNRIYEARYSRRLTRGLCISEAFGADVAIRQSISRALEGEEETSVEQVRDGDSLRSYEVTYKPLKATEHIGVACIWRDVTARVAAERQRERISSELQQVRTQAEQAIKELKESREQYRVMGEAVPYGVWLCDPQGGARYVSPSFLELLNMTFEEQQQFGWTQRLVPEDVEPMLKHWMHCIETGENWDYEHRVIDRNGEVRTVLSRGRPVHNEKGEVTSWVGINLDITDRKRMELELKQAKEAAEEANRVRSRFFANISHELRTPLTLILGPIRKRLAAPNLTIEERRDLKIAERNALTLLKHVNDLLDVARLEVGKLKPEYSRFDLAWLTRFVASHFDAIADDRKMKYTVQTPQSLLVEADPPKLQRVLLNLLSNAFKFTPEHGTVSLSLTSDGDSAHVVVADDGPGVPVDDREVIFEHFRQADEGLNRKFGGTGLGLAIVKEFVDLHQGQVAVSDSPAGGALFEVEIPIEAPHGQEVADSPPPLPAETSQQVIGELGKRSPASKVGARSDRPLILVVEDNPEMNAFIAETLSEAYEVSTAANGKEGLEQAGVLHPDLIVTDLMMPGMSGDQMIAALRERPDFDLVPVVLLTAKADDQALLRLVREGVQVYLRKPFSTEELLVAVGRLLADRELSMQTVRQLENRLRLVAEAAEVGVWHCELPSQKVVVNDQCREHLGLLKVNELTLEQMFEHVHRDDQAATREAVEAAIVTHTLYEVEFRTIGRDQRVRWLHAKGKAFYGSDGEPIYFHGITVDVSKQKQLEIALVRSEKLAATGRLAATIAHEINNPLEAITNLTYLLSNALRDEGQRGYLREIDKQLEAVTHITQQTLAFHRDGGRPLRFDLSELLEGLLRMYEPKARKQGVLLHSGLEPQRMITGFSTEIRQVISNLLVNAIDATGRGGRIVVRLKQTPDWRTLRGRGVRITIADTGSGISPEHKSRIFEPFFTTKGEKGTGLGLWVSSGIVTRAGGSLHVWSSQRAGRSGTCFSLFLPIHAEESPARRRYEMKSDSAQPKAPSA